MPLNIHWGARSPTYIAVHIKLYLGIIAPYDGTDGVCKVLEKEPEAQEGDAEVPVLTGEARHEDH